MESDRDLPEGRTPLPQITSWQESSPQRYETTHDGMIARLVQGCFALYDTIFQELAQSKSVTKKSANIIRRNNATLKLWANGHHVSNGTLDELLENSKSLQHTTLGTLNSLCNVLCNRLSKYIWSDGDTRASVLRNTDIQALYEQTKWIIHDHTSDSASDSGSSGDESQVDGIEDILHDIKMYTQCLVDLNIALECPAMDPAHEEQDTLVGNLKPRNASDYYSELILAKYPKASADLVHCLGKINWARYQRMQLERDSVARLATESVVMAEKTTISKSEFQDSGLGTSIPAQQSAYAQTVILNQAQAVDDTWHLASNNHRISRPAYAETILSFMTSLTLSRGKRLKIPPIPTEGQNGEKFECFACGRHIRVHNNRAWRKHLFDDLQPYSCFFANCNFSSAPFASRKTWTNHLELDHEFGPDWESKSCPLCQEETGSGKSAILIHFARHMEDCSLSALPCSIDSEPNSDAASSGSSVDRSHFSQHSEKSPLDGAIEKIGPPEECPCGNGDDGGVMYACGECDELHQAHCYDVNSNLCAGCRAQDYHYRVESTSEKHTDERAEEAGDLPIVCPSDSCGLLEFATMDQWKAHNAIEHSQTLDTSRIGIEEWESATRVTNSLTSTSVNEVPDINVDQSGPQDNFNNVNGITLVKSVAACVTCRRRHKRCDGAKPECNNCIRGSFICEGYTIKVGWPKNKMSQAEASIDSLDSKTTTTSQGTEKQRRESAQEKLWEQTLNDFDTESPWNRFHEAIQGPLKVGTNSSPRSARLLAEDQYPSLIDQSHITDMNGLDSQTANSSSSLPGDVYSEANSDTGLSIDNPAPIPQHSHDFEDSLVDNHNTSWQPALEARRLAPNDDRLESEEWRYPKLTCGECHESFHGRYALGNLNRHTKQKHDRPNADTPPESICRECSAAFNRADARRKHEWKKHGLPDAKPVKKRHSLYTPKSGEPVKKRHSLYTPKSGDKVVSE